MGGIIRTRLGVLTGAVILGTAGIPAAASAANAAATDLYVNNASGAHCSDSGQGTQTQPYCTVSAAARSVQPGQTVHVAQGKYPEQVTLTRSGTADAPITFVGTGGNNSARDQGTTLGVNFDNRQHALVLSGVQHIRIKDFALAGGSSTVAIDNGSDIALTGNVISSDPIPGYTGVAVTGASEDVSVVGNRVSGLGGMVSVGPGVRGTVVSTNEVRTSGSSTVPVVVDGAIDTVVVGNTLSGSCNDAVSIKGAATGTVLENNILSTADAQNHANPLCSDAPKYAGLRVDAQAAPGTKAAYNAFDSQDGSPAYNWAGTDYATVAAFVAASGQGGHDVIGKVELPWDGDSGTLDSPVIDSADENAPGMQPTDVSGTTAFDDPWVTDTGTGSGRRDRGARELVDFGTRYTAVTPNRVLDTRSGIGAPAAAVAPGATVDLPIAGLNGLPSDGITAVTLNVTVTDPTAPGYLTVHPHGAPRPTASSLNWTAGKTIPNLVTVQVKDGKVSFYNGSQGIVQVVADLLGYYSTQGGGYTPKSPVRLLDTRAGIGAPKAPLKATGTLDLAVPGLPAGVTAVTLNVTVTAPTDHGFLTVYPYGADRPTASNLNWTAGQTIPNLVTVPVKDGKVSLYAAGGYGTVQVIADLAGYYTATGGAMFHAQAPSRVLDTRYPWFASGVGEWQQPAPIGAWKDLGLRAADRAGARGGHAGAAAAYERAARLTPDRDGHTRRLVLAAEAATDAGESGRAAELAERARSRTGDPFALALIDHVLATAAFLRGDYPDAYRLLLDAAASKVEAPHAARMLFQAFHAAWYLGEDELAVVIDRLAALAIAPDDPVAPVADYLLAGTLPLLGRPARPLPDAVDAVERARRAGADVLRDLAQLSGSTLILGRDEETHRITADLVAEARRAGAVGPLPTLLFFHAEAQLFHGRHRDAEVTAAEGLALARDTAQRQWVSQLTALLALLAALAGEDGTCTALAADALDTPGPARPPGRGWTLWALALLDLGRGRAAEALDRLTGLCTGPHRHTVAGTRAVPDLVEAAVRLGAPDRAEEPYARFERWVAAGGTPWARALLLRCRALLGPDELAEADYREALELHRADDRPFEQARTALLYGEWLRRARRRADARIRLRAALEVFDRLGARPWAERARTELAAAGGGTVEEPAAGPLAALTPQELQIVRLAARGLSNRDIAAQLFLSPRTVGHHLYKAYPKLGVESRQELADLL
ncbi:LuxR C-terminal-related transcriptional regulator [Kitasatospora sp. NPDC059571]|uniref:LuxR C-terminal-related transcriptional regulator n=1 Tax=Kitasatospora sp. NPDC059571 TaxID=3346871 RepID=UPI00369D2BC0